MLVFLIALLSRLLTSLRYRVTVEGAEALRQLRGPALVLPNHPGYIDPVLVVSRLGAPLHLRPLVTTGMYRLPLLHPLMRGLRALEVPSLEQHSRHARADINEIIRRVVSGLDRGEKFLIYPTGRITPDGLEHLGSASAVPEILRQRPQTPVALVRTTGLWGSMGTMAVTGKSPDLGRCFWRALAILAANLVFFTPRRRVRITVEILPSDRRPGVAREQLNPFLESWYNRGLSSEPVFVPYHFLFGPRTFDYPRAAAGFHFDPEKIDPKTRQAVVESVERKLKRPLSDEEKRPETSLDQIGLDSFDRMDVALEIEQRFGFRTDQVAATLGDLGALAQGLAEPGAGEPLRVAKSWTPPRRDPGRPLSFSGDTLLEALVRQAAAHPGEAAAADELSGVVNYLRLLTGVRLMQKRFAALPGDAVGLMLPASVAADIAFLALLAAGKLPVLLNWTTGPHQLDHAVKVMGLQRIVTSRKFIDRTGIAVGGAEFVFLEEVRRGIGKPEMLATLLSTRLLGARLLRRLPSPDPGAPAVVLFTSGSEKAPKAVPLTHRNILADVTAGAAALGFRRDDILLGFLPPFHSFGLSGNMMLSLLGGMRVVHHADPTDARGLVRKIAAFRPTVLLSTPTFFQYILGAGQPEDLASLRVVITGAEKCPETVFARAREKTPRAFVAEGYGITECSPVVSVNRPDAAKPGSIGRPLDGVEVLVVDPDTMEPLGAGKQGLLLVHGPTVFPGYLHHDGPSPFHEHDGKRWYVTGDLARVDGDGFIQFAGRLKRFIKAGGEMISLPALEEPIAAAYPANDQGPQVAVEGIETPQGRHIVLFATADVPLGRANALLAEAGFRGVMRIDEVRRVERLPVLGTGKIDYKVLRAQIADRPG
jgi:long-chain-fatty-acid--[acyl-carrier-protein] ligase